VTEAIENANKLIKKEEELELLNITLEERIRREVEKNREKDRVMFQQARFAAMGEMIANIAHQWRQPLSELNILLFKLKKACLKGLELKKKIDKNQKEIIEISICDNGNGIREDIIGKIFDPYFTTKHSSQGTGIGLYMSKKIIERSKGALKIKNSKNGACFIICLPKTKE